MRDFGGDKAPDDTVLMTVAFQTRTGPPDYFQVVGSSREQCVSLLTEILPKRPAEPLGG